jgi:hypothetical protein
MNMTRLAFRLALASLIAVPAFMHSANAQQSNGRSTARERAIHECMAMNKRYNNDPYSATGGVQHMYQACMADRGYPP